MPSKAPPAFGRHVDDGALEQLEQSLLHTFAADVACDARVVLLASYLVYLVDEDDAALGSSHVVVGHLQQAREDALHVLAHVAGLGEHGGVDDGEGHLEQFCDGACQQGLARARCADHDDVALFYLHAIVVDLLGQTLVVVIDGNRQVALCAVLPDDVLVEEGLDVARLGNVVHVEVGIVAALRATLTAPILTKYLVCLTNTLVAYVAVDACQHQGHLILAASAKGATVLVPACHPWSLILNL